MLCDCIYKILLYTNKNYLNFISCFIVRKKARNTKLKLRSSVLYLDQVSIGLSFNTQNTGNTFVDIVTAKFA